MSAAKPSPPRWPRPWSSSTAAAARTRSARRCSPAASTCTRRCTACRTRCSTTRPPTHVSPRHLARLFAEHVGSSPRAWIEDLRVALAERALREGRATKQAVAEAGLGGPRQWRRLRARRRPAETPG
ncbi:helix-turn-helix domain-containing protein [Rubrivivax gelatinosus]|uniref:helix-turn-helix domain-containing protein n=1 Tax=Rubrivivax gelatinosus TaxID=28068 RepID=UPI003F798287